MTMINWGKTPIWLKQAIVT